MLSLSFKFISVIINPRFDVESGFVVNNCINKNERDLRVDVKRGQLDAIVESVSRDRDHLVELFEFLLWSSVLGCDDEGLSSVRTAYHCNVGTTGLLSGIVSHCSFVAFMI